MDITITYDVKGQTLLPRDVRGRTLEMSGRRRPIRLKHSTYGDDNMFDHVHVCRIDLFRLCLVVDDVMTSRP